MENACALTLGMAHNRPISFLCNGRFDWNGLLPGAWLAAYTPLDGAMLLTTQPPGGFIGVDQSSLTSTLDASHGQLNILNLAGMDLLVDVFSSWANPSPIRDGILLPLVRLVIKARNHTHNVLPISLAFSWQDLLEKSPGPCLPSPQGLSIALGDGTRLRTTCSQTHTHFSFYTGWNPKGDGEEIWDDFFAYGELGCQHDVSFASILCLQSLVAPQAEILAQFYLLNEPDLHEL